MACLEDPAPLLDGKLKCLCLAHGETLVPAHLWIEEINTSLLKAGHSPGDALQDWRPFHFTSHCISLSILPFDFNSSLILFLWSIKEPGIQTPRRWLFWGRAFHVLGLPAPRLKSLPCLNTLSLGFIGLLYGKENKLGLGNTWRRKRQPTPVFLPGKYHGQRSLARYSPWNLQRVRHDWATKQLVLQLLAFANYLNPTHPSMF